MGRRSGSELDIATTNDRWSMTPSPGEAPVAWSILSYVYWGCGICDDYLRLASSVIPKSEKYAGCKRWGTNSLAYLAVAIDR